jgi:hypothetical protein
MPAWIPRTFEEACKRAAGRRRYHTERRLARDQRQLIVMEVLLRFNWQSFGVGRILAKNFWVDATTISRDIRYLRKLRRSFIAQNRSAIGGPGVRLMFGIGERASENFVNAVMRSLVRARIHPRLGYSWTITIVNGRP